MAMLRRDGRLFLRCLASGIVLFLLLGTGCVLAAGAVIHRSASVYTPVRVAVIDHEDSVFSRILIGFAAGTEEVSRLLSCEIMEESDAMDALLRGDAAAVVELPSGFLSDMTSGTRGEGVIILSDGAKRHGEVVRSIAKFGEELLLAGQAGVFAGEELLRASGDPSVVDEFLDRSNAALLNEAMGASERYFRMEILDYHDTGMSSSAYFGMCWLTLLLFLVSLLFIPLFTRDTKPTVLRRLCAEGVRKVRFMGWKLVFPALFRLLLAFGVLFFLGRWLDVGLTPLGIAGMTAAVCFVTLFGTAASFAMGDGVTMNVLFGFGGLFLCGGLVPRQVLPHWVTALGDLTPFGTALELMKPAFGGEASPVSLLFAIGYGVLAAWLMGRRLERRMMGEVSA